MEEDYKDIILNINKKLEKKKAVRLNDSFGTIIYINKNENEEKVVKKYLSRLENDNKFSIVSMHKAQKGE